MVDCEKNMEQTIALAGLLHDIGKFLNRGSELTIGLEKKHHPFLSRLFVEELESKNIIEKNELLKILVQRHHEYAEMDSELLVQNIEIKK